MPGAAWPEKRWSRRRRNERNGPRRHRELSVRYGKRLVLDRVCCRYRGLGVSAPRPQRRGQELLVRCCWGAAAGSGASACGRGCLAERARAPREFGVVPGSLTPAFDDARQLAVSAPVSIPPGTARDSRRGWNASACLPELPRSALKGQKGQVTPPWPWRARRGCSSWTSHPGA